MFLNCKNLTILYGHNQFLNSSNNYNTFQQVHQFVNNERLIVDKQGLKNNLIEYELISLNVKGDVIR